MGHRVGGVVVGDPLHRPRAVAALQPDDVRPLPPARARASSTSAAPRSATPTGALVLMGYPYPFDDLVVIDLPSEERNELYREDTAHEVTQTALGPVRYRYHSMVDLSDYPDDSVDLVYSGQSIEHVPPDVAAKVLSEVHRVLRPGGYLGIDTPNARVTRLQQPEFIDPDHEHEYTDAEMRALLSAGRLRGRGGVGPEPRRAEPGRGPLRRRPGGHGAGHVPPDRGLLPVGLPGRVPGLTARAGRRMPGRRVRARGLEPPPPRGDRDLNPARLPIPPRPQRSRSAGEQGVYGGVPTGARSGH